MPLLLIPALSGLFGFGTGWFTGSSSSGWLKWLLILAVLVMLFVFSKKLGLIKK